MKNKSRYSSSNKISRDMGRKKKLRKCSRERRKFTARQSRNLKFLYLQRQKKERKAKREKSRGDSIRIQKLIAWPKSLCRTKIINLKLIGQSWQALEWFNYPNLIVMKFLMQLLRLLSHPKGILKSNLSNKMLSMKSMMMKMKILQHLVEKSLLG